MPTITGEVKRHFRDHMWTLQVPRRVQELRNRVRAAARELPQTVPAAAADRRRDRRARRADRGGGRAPVMEALESFSALSLDAELPGSDDGYSLRDALGGAGPGATTPSSTARPSSTGWPRCPERERAILYMRFFGDMTQSSIAEELGISQMHVSRLISRSCARVRADVMGQRRNPHGTDGHSATV